MLLAIGEYDRLNGGRLTSTQKVDLADAIVERGSAKAITAGWMREWLRLNLEAQVSERYASGLTRVIKALPPPARAPLDLVVLGFRAEAQRSATRLFELTQFEHEEVARTLLMFYLMPRGYAEARLGAGRGDIVIPEPSAVIETKLVRGRDDPHVGASQLADYLEAESRPGIRPDGFLLLIVRDQLPPYASQLGPSLTVRNWPMQVIWIVIPTEGPSTKGRRIARAMRRAESPP